MNQSKKKNVNVKTKFYTVVDKQVTKNKRNR